MDTDRPAEAPESAETAKPARKHPENFERVAVRELQRHTSEVLERVEANGQIYITKHGRIIARILPPDPAEEQINDAIAAGILDPRALTGPNTGADLLRDFVPAPTRQGQKSLTDIVIEAREAEGDK